MRSLVPTFLILLMVAVFTPAAAQDVNVRTGTHKDYSRLVFDWQTPVTYTLEKSGAALNITFSKAASIDASKAAAPVANIESLEVKAKDPLSVLLSIPEGSRIRDLKVGQKVIIDVYNPPGGARKNAPLRVKMLEPPKNEPPKPAPEKTEEKPPQSPQSKPEVTQIKAKDAQTTIAISSTQSFGMAVFENAGHLWLVNDKTDILITPQVSGPYAKNMGDFKESFAENAKIYRTPMPDNVKVKGQGGGVLWRVLLAGEMDNSNTPSAPVRKDVRDNEIRGGKIMWPLPSARNVVHTVDAYTGEKIIVVTVENADEFAGPARQFVDFDVLHTPVGLAVVPKIDDLNVEVVRGGVEISAPGGLALLPQKVIDNAKRLQERKKAPESETADMRRVYDFQNWQLGGPKAVQKNRNEILGSLKDMQDTDQVEALLTLGKMYLSNGMGAEALGALNFAAAELSSLRRAPEFLALRGAARALTGHYEEAFSDLSQDKLKDLGEVQIWRAYALANLGDWQQAIETKPKALEPVFEYPPRIRNMLALTLAEIALRNGEAGQGKNMLDIVSQDGGPLPLYHKAALQYLKGEAARQDGNLVQTKSLWEPLTKGKDDLYRSKAGLAMTRLLMEDGELSSGKAIDRLERLRYSWRGDQLEAQTNFWLGKTYFENGEHIKGLKIMRDAASYVPNTNLSQRIAENMSVTFTDLFLNEDMLAKVAPVEAAALYDQFAELLPSTEVGDDVVKKLANHLARADMFGRAGSLLATQLARLEGEKALNFGTRLAAIRLLDREPGLAVEALNQAASALESLPEEMRTDAKYREISLLRARAMSLQGRPDQALAMLERLENEPDTNRLRADIAWESSYWDDAAEALDDVILDKNISLTRPLEDENTELLLRRAVALNLASDRIALANMREKYTDLMSQTDKAKIFEVITRPRQSAALTDRETMLSIVSEIELFSDFLNSYREIDFN